LPVFKDQAIRVLIKGRGFRTVSLDFPN
jgi:hypothetical protein